MTWNKETALSEILTLQYGKGLPKRKREKGLYPVYGSGGVIDYHSDFLVKGPGIIVGRKGSIGTVYFSNDNFWPIDTVYYVELDSNSHNLRYIYYLLNSLDLDQLNSDAAVPGLNRNIAYSQKCSVPSLHTQRKIAAILSAYDDFIENNNHRIAILEEMAQLLYREWFVRFRFPGHEDVEMVDSEIGEIPAGWELTTLSELVDTQYGYTESASDDEVGPKFVRGTDINKTTYIDWSTVPYCPIDEDKLEKYRLYPGDILVVRMATPGKVGIVEGKAIPESVFASYLIRLTIEDDKLSPYYLYYTLMSYRYQGYITGASTGTTRKSASAGVITDFDTVIPPEDIRSQFEEHISELRKLIVQLISRNNVLREIRDLLLPRLISGELDVSDLDIDTHMLD